MSRSYAVVVQILLFSTLGLLHAQDTDDIRTVLQNSLELGSTCIDSPCLFGQSLRGMSYDQVQRIISNSNMRDSLFLVDAPRGTIRWIWAPEIALTLGVDVYSEILTEDVYSFISEFSSFNNVSFRDGMADGVWLHFETELSTLVQTYGEPLLIAPWSYTRFGDMTFHIIFPDVEGYFTAITRCDSPELVASTRIIGHSSTVEEPYISGEALEWQGYTDALPDCTIFQP